MNSGYSGGMRPRAAPHQGVLNGLALDLSEVTPQALEEGVRACYDSLPGASWTSLLQKNCHTISEARTPEVKDFIGGHGMGELFTDVAPGPFYTPFDALTVQALLLTCLPQVGRGRAECQELALAPLLVALHPEGSQKEWCWVVRALGRDVWVVSPAQLLKSQKLAGGWGKHSCGFWFPTGRK